MVSKLDILARYYQIYLNELNDHYFVYEGKCYYLATLPIENEVCDLYNKYILDLNVSGFFEVVNCYNSVFSEGCVLYTFVMQNINIDRYLYLSGQPLEDKTVSLDNIKQRWCMKVDDVRACVGKHASRIALNEYYVILSYYYQGMAENAVQVLNWIMMNNDSKKIPLGLQHIVCTQKYASIVNPHNLIISSRTRDILMLYKNRYVSLLDVENFIKQHDLLPIELQYMFARILFPSEIFSLIMDNNIEDVELKKQLRWCYNNLHSDMVLILDLFQLLSNYVSLPEIKWLFQV